MAKILDGDDLIVGTNITIDTTARTFTLIASADGVTTNGLIAKDGVTIQALYSKFIKLWETSTYNQFPFPMYAIDAKSGQYQFGFDGSRYSDWGPADETTRNMLRDGGWDEYQAGGTPELDGTSQTGDLARRYVGILSLGTVNEGAQLYYQTTAGSASVDFVFTDEVNQGVQIFGDSAVDATSADIDTQTFFKAFAREEGFTYATSTLADTGQTATGAYTVSVLLSNTQDLNVVNTDAEIVGAQSGTYTPITVSYYSVAQIIDINDPADDFPFSIVIDANNATLQQVYTKIQYLLRQDSDINSAIADSLGVVNGKTADSLLRFVGPDLICAEGVFIQNLRAQDINNVFFTDDNGTARTYDFAATLSLNFNNFLTSGSTGYYVVYITDSVAGGDDYGSSTAIILQDNQDADITGTITGSSLTFSIDYDNNSQGGRSDFSAATGQIPITVVAGNKGVAKPVVATGLIERTKSNSVTLTAEQDRAYTP